MNLNPYQKHAIDAIQTAWNQHQKHIVLEMASGIKTSVVLYKTIEFLQKNSNHKILLVFDRVEIKDQVINEASVNYSESTVYDKHNITIEISQNILSSNIHMAGYDVIIFYDAYISIEIYKTLLCQKKTVILFTAITQKSDNSIRHKYLFSDKDIVFSYTYQEAIRDGYITPAMDPRARGFAFEDYSRKLLESLGFKQIDPSNKVYEYNWDLVFQNNDKTVWVECKAYKSQSVSPSIANQLLKKLVMRKDKQNSSHDIILLIMPNHIPSFQKSVIFERYRIVVWDIENLVFYSKNDPVLLNQLAQIAYFPIDHIPGQHSAEAETAELISTDVVVKHLELTEKESNKNRVLIKELENCPAGKKNSRIFEEICEKILRHLFEANCFNRLTNQHKTSDEHFRMDLIGSLKITPNNDEGMHPLWQLLVRHYNSHFVVFEFKNYSEKIDQNLIYITEKYLYDAALRNVAFVISREGFSDSAKFAAEGCLKEHGKLILDITQDDLINMLESPDDDPADYILAKLEDFLMGISK